MISSTGCLTVRRRLHSREEYFLDCYDVLIKLRHNRAQKFWMVLTQPTRFVAVHDSVIAPAHVREHTDEKSSERCHLCRCKVWSVKSIDLRRGGEIEGLSLVFGDAGIDHGILQARHAAAKGEVVNREDVIPRQVRLGGGRDVGVRSHGMLDREILRVGVFMNLFEDCGVHVWDPDVVVFLMGTDDAGNLHFRVFGEASFGFLNCS